MTTIHTIRFYKEEGFWYADLPKYLEMGGDKEDLVMVLGADVMLDILSKNEEEITLKISEQPVFEEILTLGEECDVENGGGAVYYWEQDGGIWSRQLWLCDVTKFVFNKFPEKLYFKIDNASTTN